MIPNFLDKKFNKNIKVSDFGCWEWQACLNSTGYGVLKRRKIFGNKQLKAHRYSWFLTFGKLPDLHLCHKCDNTKCVRPDHLFEGTAKDNSDDKISKGRDKYADQCGENNGNSTLTGIDVENIRNRILNLESNRSIAKSYGVTDSMISRIKLGRSWK